VPPIIALGASAGGLEPLEAFFAAAPSDAGWSFVVIQHLSPDYRSMMDELLARHTELAIEIIEDGTELAPDTIFLNPPNALARLEGGEFRLTPYEPGDALPHLPIDAFFASLARREGGPDVAVVMSGSGADGAEGVAALHEAGGFVVVQTPRTAKFASMPRAALATGAVDRVAEPADMPQAVAELLARGGERPAVPSLPEDPWQAILRLIERAHRIDFSVYKAPTVMRRIERRMTLRGFESVEEYRDHLAETPPALEELYSDMLIGVTAFYRDPEAIAALARQGIGPIVSRASESDDIRVWVPACASGEEAYTIAIELSEAIRTAGLKRTFRVIATDVHRPSVETAAAGIYPDEALAKVPEAIRSRYFVEHRDGWEVDRALRQSVIFSVHNALADPPFMRLDLVSCRNLMIYLDDTAQKRLLSMFLFALKKEGVLFLGNAESVGALPDEFETTDSGARIYSKRSDRRLFDPDIMGGRLNQPRREARGEAPPRAARPPLAALDRAGRSKPDRDALIRGYDALLKRFAPSSILITDGGEVLTWFGGASAYIDTMSDLAERTVEEIVHPALRYPINVGIEHLRQEGISRFEREVSVGGDDGGGHRLTVRIEPLSGAGGGGRFLLVVLSRTEGAAPPAEDVPEDAAEHGETGRLIARIRELERDLRLTEESLQYVTERLETSGEELQASNEELQASNEELQASNEELQSSNEELQATNEELVSVSAEHERKIEMLRALNADTELVVDMLGYGVIVLDSDLRIRRFTGLCARAFGLEPRDEGRKIVHVGAKPEGVDTAELARDALERREAKAAEGTLEGRALRVEAVPAGATGDEDRRVALLFSGPALGGPDG
jgi:two-component system CheB/CheR fusion protein